MNAAGASTRTGEGSGVDHVWAAGTTGDGWGGQEKCQQCVEGKAGKFVCVCRDAFNSVKDEYWQAGEKIGIEEKEAANILILRVN